jgi:DNA-binding XRE family transcriptional regulator
MTTTSERYQALYALKPPIDPLPPKTEWAGEGNEDITAYCNKCRCRVVPRDDGRCGWCDTQTKPAPQPDPPNAVDLVVARRLLSSGVGQRLREQAGLTVRDVARHIDCGHTSVIRWERGEATMTHRHATAYVRLMRDLKALGQGG